MWDDRRYNFIIELLTGVHTIKASAMEAQMMRRYERLQESNARAGYAVALFYFVPRIERLSHAMSDARSTNTMRHCGSNVLSMAPRVADMMPPPMRTTSATSGSTVIMVAPCLVDSSITRTDSIRPMNVLAITIRIWING